MVLAMVEQNIHDTQHIRYDAQKIYAGPKPYVTCQARRSGTIPKHFLHVFVIFFKKEIKLFILYMAVLHYSSNIVMFLF